MWSYQVEVRNFLGEKRVRRVELAPGVTYVRTADVKDQIELSGNDLTAVSITGASAIPRMSSLVKGGGDSRGA